ncbi:hypothetical protein SEMRO_1753_G295390.1 [Seminavis robusta]|uniref:Uncharacterized protein n=1 Tax=Seminavis robusta TaxID=568900 RepID=A0A9N8EVR7_9STRA|nr:hypothetical protein SEMRO_1753_G295390.1 [Seminavis robusta]|eukprot:Sro1753_g295390.1 n/a (371) ;mRNA; r:1859-2971
MDVRRQSRSLSPERVYVAVRRYTRSLSPQGECKSVRHESRSLRPQRQRIDVWRQSRSLSPGRQLVVRRKSRSLTPQRNGVAVRRQSRSLSPRRGFHPSNRDTTRRNRPRTVSPQRQRRRNSERSQRTAATATTAASTISDNTSITTVLLDPVKALNIQMFPQNVPRNTKGAPRANQGLLAKHLMATYPTRSLTKEMNILGSEGLVSTQFILNSIAKVQQNQDIVKLELEDWLGRSKHAQRIAIALRELMMHDHRPWESIRFVDYVHASDVDTFQQWVDQKNLFQSCLGSIFLEKLVPVHFDCIVTLPASTGKEDSVTLLNLMQQEPSVTKLVFASNQSDPVMLKALVDLFQCDNRSWKDVTLHLSGQFAW